MMHSDPPHVWPQARVDDPFATIHRSIHTGSIPVPLLLSADQFPLRVGRYEILRRLGEGQMGAVFLARELGRHVAIKVSKFAPGRETIDRFAREARVMAGLQHPNICPVYDFGEWDEARYFSMAYVEGRTLEQVLEAEPPDSDRRIAEMIGRLAVALHAAHQAGVVHRDLKPANVMVTPAGEPIIMDFGLARSEEGGSIVTKNGVMLGTPAYMSPEQVLGHCELVGPASDIYGLGVVMYQMLAGRVPFDGKLVEVLKQIVSAEPTPPSHFKPEVNRRLEAICLQAMAKSIANRFTSANELADALRDL